MKIKSVTNNLMPNNCLSYFFLLIVFFCSTSHSQTYSIINVKNRVQLQIPSDWVVDDSEHRKRVLDLAEQISGVKNLNLASLSVHSFPSPSKMFVRVSFIKMEPPLKQSDLQKEIISNRQALLHEIENSWKTEAQAMWAALEKTGVREVGNPSFYIESLGGQVAIVIRYSRTSPGNPSIIMKVAQYHVHLGSEKVLITLSFLEGDSVIKSVHDKLKNSIIFK